MLTVRRGDRPQLYAAGREGAQRFFMPAPTQHTLGMLAANAPEDIRTEVTRLPAYATR